MTASHRNSASVNLANVQSSLLARSATGTWICFLTDVLWLVGLFFKWQCDLHTKELDSLPVGSAGSCDCGANSTAQEDSGLELWLFLLFSAPYPSLERQSRSGNVWTLAPDYSPPPLRNWNWFAWLNNVLFCLQNACNIFHSQACQTCFGFC